jgi:hypothetical protein
MLIFGLVVFYSGSCQFIQCFTRQSDTSWFLVRSQLTQSGASSTGILKFVRINYHFMLKSDGSGNFNELNDGDGRLYSGYDFANDITQAMNDRNSWNEKMNILPNNTTAYPEKNYKYVLDAVYFHRDDVTHYKKMIDYPNQGRDKDNVVNIFLTEDNTFPPGGGGYASSLDQNSKIKFTENWFGWQQYKINMANSYPWGWTLHANSQQFNHEIGHLLGLSHTVMWNDGIPCQTGCPGSGVVNLLCDDGCADTPTAWEVTSANGCTVHPAGIWNTGNDPWKSNNLMDYNGANALTPCQINIIHSSLEGGMRSYTACDAVTTDRSYCDLAYPRVTYFGKNVSVGMCPGTVADVTSKEKLAVWFSGSLELGQFEVKDHSELEAIFHGICLF